MISREADLRAGPLLRRLRHRSGLSLRALAARAGTSHPTLSSYERGHKQPELSTLIRVARSVGFAVDLTAERRFGAAEGRGTELEAVLDLAELFPAEHATDPNYPVFPRSTNQEP